MNPKTWNQVAHHHLLSMDSPASCRNITHSWESATSELFWHKTTPYSCLKIGSEDPPSLSSLHPIAIWQWWFQQWRVQIFLLGYFFPFWPWTKINSQNGIRIFMWKTGHVISCACLQDIQHRKFQILRATKSLKKHILSSEVRLLPCLIPKQDHVYLGWRLKGKMVRIPRYYLLACNHEEDNSGFWLVQNLAEPTLKVN